MTGRKCHLLVDTHDTIIAVVVHPAAIQDRDGAYVGGERAVAHTSRGTPFWAAAAYWGTVARWVTAAWGGTIAIGQRAPAVVGFAVQPRRWVVERTCGWLGRCRRLSKDYDEYPVTSAAWIALVMDALLLRRLCPSS